MAGVPDRQVRWGSRLSAALLALLSVGADSRAASAEAAFSLPSPAPGTFRAALLSDFNPSYGQTVYPPEVPRLVRLIGGWKPQVVLSAGDLIGGQKASLTDGQVRAMWASLDRTVVAPLKSLGLPFAFTLGNHDASLKRDRAEAAAFWQAHAPALAYQDRSGFPFRYTFTLDGGQIFVAMLDDPYAAVSANQRAWLAAQLASPAAQGAGIRLVFGHVPLAGVSAEKNRPGEVVGAADALALRAVLERGRVLAFVHGHHAAYYPGRLASVTGGAGLNVLASGGIGARAYVGPGGRGSSGRARSTVTVMDLQPQRGRLSLTTFDADTGERVESTSLPARLDGIGGPLTRVDGDFRLP